MSTTSYIFSICARIENKKHLDLLKQCIESIRKFHPLTEIVIVDSNSPVDYSDIVSEKYNVKVDCIKNTGYELGAQLHTFKNYNKDYYIFLQDSMKLTNSIEEYLPKDGFGVYRVREGGSNFSPAARHECAELLRESNYIVLDDSDFKMVEFSSFIISNSILKKVIENGIGTTLPNNKAGSCGSERMWGMVMAQEGYDLGVKEQLLTLGIIEKKWIGRK